MLLFNEIENTDNQQVFDKYIKYLNKHSLFDNPKLAKEYIDFRKEKLNLKEVNLERAWKGGNVDVVKVFCLERYASIKAE